MNFSFNKRASSMPMMTPRSIVSDTVTLDHFLHLAVITPISVNRRAMSFTHGLVN